VHAAAECHDLIRVVGSRVNEPQVGTRDRLDSLDLEAVPGSGG